MPTCSFCKKNYKFPRGLTLFTLDGRSVYFCSSKCRRNHNLKRDPKKIGWSRRSIKNSENKVVLETEGYKTAGVKKVEN